MLFRNLVIASPEELDETEPVPEGIGHKGELTPLVGRDRLLQPCSGRYSSLDRRFDFRNDKIKMDRCPVALVTSILRGGFRGRCTGGLDEQVDWSGASKHLYSEGTEATADLQSERRAVKADCLVEIINIEIYQEVHSL
jgi:hypothetical protein